MLSKVLSLFVKTKCRYYDFQHFHIFEFKLMSILSQSCWVSDNMFTQPCNIVTSNSFHVLWGLSIDIMLFILYKLLIKSPNPNPEDNPHRKHTEFSKNKTLFSLIYKPFSSWGKPKYFPSSFWILPSLWKNIVPRNTDTHKQDKTISNI